MNIDIKDTVLAELRGLEGRIYQRVGNSTPGADFKLPDTVKAILLANSGKTFTIENVDVKGMKPRGQNISRKQTNAEGVETTVTTQIPNGKFDCVVLVTGKYSGVNESVTFKTTLAEIATANPKGEIVIEAQILGEVRNDNGDITKAGNIWVHGTTAASAEQQIAFAESLTTAKGTPKLQP